VHVAVHDPGEKPGVTDVLQGRAGADVVEGRDPVDAAPPHVNGGRPHPLRKHDVPRAEDALAAGLATAAHGPFAPWATHAPSAARSSGFILVMLASGMLRSLTARSSICDAWAMICSGVSNMTPLGAWL
jgi:hypothetical protein